MIESDPLAQALDAAAESLVALRRFRDTSVDLIVVCNQESAAATQQVAEQANAIVGISQSYIQRIESQVSALRQSEAGDGFTQCIQEQQLTIQSFVQVINQELANQQGLIEDVLGRSNQLSRVGRSVEQVASATRIVSLNAMLEAARLGEHGLGLAVIAKEMKKLSDEVVSLSHNITSFLHDMNRLLPGLQGSTTTLHRRSQRFSEDVSGQADQIQRYNSQLEDLLSSSSSAGSQCVEEILQRMYQILGALQFQDPNAQRLQELEQMVLDTEARLAERFALSREPVEQRWKPNLGTRSIFDEPAPPDEEPTLTGGEMLLF